MTDIAIIRSMGGLVFDAVFEESHQSDLEVTDNPVESGVMVSDHAFMKPLQLTISAGVSDTPLFDVDALGDFDKFKSDNGRSKKAYELLTELQAKAEPFDVQTGLKLYKNMVCTSLRTKQDKDTGGALFFEATLREVIIVYTQVVKYSPSRRAGATARQAAANKDKGEQRGNEESGKRASILAKITKAIGN